MLQYQALGFSLASGRRMPAATAAARLCCWKKRGAACHSEHPLPSEGGRLPTVRLLALVQMRQYLSKDRNYSQEFRIEYVLFPEEKL